MSYRYKKPYKTSINVSKESYEGERIEEKVERLMSNKEGVKDGAPEIFTERKDGVLPAFNVRTDRFEVATEAMDAVTRSRTAKRMEVVRDNDIDEKVTDNEKKNITESNSKTEG